MEVQIQTQNTAGNAKARDSSGKIRNAAHFSPEKVQTWTRIPVAEIKAGTVIPTEFGRNPTGAAALGPYCGELLPREEPKLRETVESKLQRARVMLQSKELRKSGLNNFTGHRYFEMSDFMPSLNIILDALKLVTGLTVKDGLATLTVINSENPEERVIFEAQTSPVELKNNTPMQNLGAVITYVTRYLYLMAFAIAESDVLDALTGKIHEAVNIGKSSETGLNIEKTIASISNLGELNSAFKLLKSNEDKLPDDNWKKALTEKGKALGASFDANAWIFVLTRKVCGRKSDAVAKMVN
jgi:hypothetical protein